MSDELVRGFIFGLAVMFFAPALNPLISGRRGRIGSFLIGVALTCVAFKWPSIKDHAGPAMNAFLYQTASNGYAWSGLIIVTWIYCAIDSLSAPYRGTRPPRTKPSVLDRAMNLFGSRLPETLDNDKEYLVKEFGRWKGSRAQIFYDPSEGCFRLSKEFSDILKAAGWEQVDVPMPIPSDAKARRGFTLRYSTTPPAYGAGLSLVVSLRTIGIEPRNQPSSDLRQFDYCFVYIAA